MLFKRILTAHMAMLVPSTLGIKVAVQGCDDVTLTDNIKRDDVMTKSSQAKMLLVMVALLGQHPAQACTSCVTSDVDEQACVDNIAFSKNFEASLTYSERSGLGTRPYTWARVKDEDDPFPEHTKAVHGDETQLNVTVQDARDMNLKFDDVGFELVPQETSLATDDFFKFYKDDDIKQTYFKEIKELIKKETGAKYVTIHNYVIRGSSPTSLGESIQRIDHFIQYAHSDVAPYSAMEEFKKHVKDLPEEAQAGRFLHLNAWRNIEETPIANNPLIVLDERSTTKPDDYIEAEVFVPEDGQFAPGYSGLIYKLHYQNAHRHQWYYYPAMTKDEVLLIKQWDSDTSRTARTGFHASVIDPNAPTNIPRQSIEVRAIAFFPGVEPNSCPSLNDTHLQKNFGKVVETDVFNIDSVHDAMKQMFAKDVLQTKWPPLGIQYMRRLMSGDAENGVEEMALVAFTYGRGDTSTTENPSVIATGIGDDGIRSTVHAAMEKYPDLKGYIEHNFATVEDQGNLRWLMNTVYAKVADAFA